MPRRPVVWYRRANGTKFRVRDPKKIAMYDMLEARGLSYAPKRLNQTPRAPKEVGPVDG